MYFLREQLFESLWLLISVAAALCFLSKFSPQVKAFSVLMCINTSLECNIFIGCYLARYMGGGICLE